MDDRATGAGSRRVAFARTLTSALHLRGMTQVRLAAELGGIAQSAVSAWTTGTSTPRHDVVFRVEQILELPPGHLSSHLGYLPVGAEPPSSVEDAIEADALLTDVQRRALLALYREFISR